MTTLFILVFAGALAAGDSGMTVIAAHDDAAYRHSESSAIELPDGRLLLAWSRFAGAAGDDNGKATIVLAESADDGRTWSDPRALPVGSAATNIMQAAFLPVRGRLTLAFSVRGGGKSIKYAIDSVDGGALGPNVGSSSTQEVPTTVRCA